jgi:phosphate transport system substrate-binding protein
MKKIGIVIAVSLALGACSDYFKNDYTDNSPTSGKLNVYCDEGLKLHIQNQAQTFESQYNRADIHVIASSDAEAVQALYNDSCKAIVISRELTDNEKQSFKSKDLNPGFSIVAYSGIALITNTATNISKLTTQQLEQLLLQPFVCVDSINSNCKITVVFESDRSSVVHYLKNDVIKNKNFSENCSALKNTVEVINYIAKTPNAIGFIDFAWLSDRDDSLYKANKDKIKFVPIGKGDGAYFEPNQSSFKTGEYPLTRKVYVYKQAPDFSLAKGFETFVAGPKGQMIFLKQGLLPYKQQERNIEVKLEQ